MYLLVSLLVLGQVRVGEVPEDGGGLGDAQLVQTEGRDGGGGKATVWFIYVMMEREEEIAVLGVRKFVIVRMRRVLGGGERPRGKEGRTNYSHQEVAACGGEKREGGEADVKTMTTRKLFESLAKLVVVQACI